jgi:hypothetical protein
VRFENKNILFYFEKTLEPFTTLAEVVGLAPGHAVQSSF